MSSPRILYLSPPWTYASIRSLHVARALQQVGKVDRVIVHAEDERAASTRDYGSGFDVLCEFDVQPLPDGGAVKKLVRLLNNQAPFPHGVRVDERGHETLAARLKEYDLIWWFKLRTANMFELPLCPASVLDIDDLPSGLYESSLSVCANLLERIRVWIQIHTWKRREHQLGRRFRTLAVCSSADKARLKVNAPVHVVPNGFVRPVVMPVRNPVAPPRIGFIGLFDYFANRDGVRWFISQCWEKIKREIPDARLRLVGRGSDGDLAELGIDVDGLGWVEDAAAEIGTWSLMIVPLRQGGGTRQKIAESFSRKCPIVSTTVGAYGYEVENGRELFLADDPAEFARACIRLICNPGEASQMAERAWERFLQKWTWDAIAPRIWAAAEDGLRHAGNGSVTKCHGMTGVVAEAN